jgi:transketolase
VVTSYANFLVFRAVEQIRVDIATSRQNVKLIGSDTGFSAEWLGFTHHAIEDIAAIRAVPGIVIIDPSDAEETYQATKEIFNYNGPVYLRIRGRKEEPLITVPRENFRIGKGQVLSKGGDVLVIACGSAVNESLIASEILKLDGIKATVINMSTIRPLDEELIAEYASSIKNIVTVEHHNISGGLGSAVAEFLSENITGTRLKRIGVENRFSEAGSVEMLMKEFGLDGEGIAAKVKGFLSNI